MIHPLRAAGAALLLAFVAAAPGVAEPSSTAQSLRTVPLKITGSGKARTFKVEVAATPEQQETGLMYRKTMVPITA